MRSKSYMLHAILISLLILLNTTAQQVPENPMSGIKAEFSDKDGDGHIGSDKTDQEILDDPEGTYEKLDTAEKQPCDDGIGPNPNILSALPNQKNQDDRDQEPKTKIERIVSNTLEKYKNIDMSTGRNFLKPPKKRIPMCPGAKPRAPIPGIDCTLSKFEPEKVDCCKCGCGCGCGTRMLRRVIKRTVNRHGNINMDTGKPYKDLPSCKDLTDPLVHVVESDPQVPLHGMLMKKVHEDDLKRSKR